MMRKFSWVLLVLMVLVGCKSLKDLVKDEVTVAKNITWDKDGAEMVLIPSGSFEIGDHLDGMSNAPVHTVELDAFYMDVNEVTVGQFKQFVNHSGYDYPEDWDEVDKCSPGDDYPVTHVNGNDATSYAKWADKRLPAEADKRLPTEVDKYSPGNDYPVTHVNWNDAVAYAKWVGKRLPTEAEWEYAARGGLVGKRYPGGDEITHDDANWGDTVDGKDKWKYCSPVRSFEANGYGLYDMAGNVWEWCANWYSSDYYSKSSSKNPPGPVSGSSRVLRGGALDQRCLRSTGSYP